MAKEIERKFLVINDSFVKMAEKVLHIEQGYISHRPEGTVRVRIKADKGYITIKSKNEGASRDEWEYEIPVHDAKQMLDTVCEGNIIIKDRHIVSYGNHTWEIDVFHGKNEGLTVAEVELKNADENITLPPFIGEEVTGNAKYYNSNL